MDNLKITMGQELPKEAWLAAAHNLQQAAQPIAAWLARINHEGMGREDAESFVADITLAVAAMVHVAEFATDKVRIIALPEEAENG